MTRDEMKSVIEGLIFVSGGEGIDVQTIATTLDCDREVALELALELQQELKEQRRGLQIIEVAGAFQMTTRLEHAPFIEKLATTKSRSGLSQAALETLAIIAYEQPITRAEIEDIRGVRSEKALQTLINRNLVEEKGRSDAIGRPILYGVTRQFMEYFGLKRMDDLPPLPIDPPEEEARYLFDKMEEER